MDSKNKPSPASPTGRIGATQGGTLTEHTDPVTGRVSADYSGLERRALLHSSPPAHLSHFIPRHLTGAVTGIGCVTTPEVKLYSQAELDSAVKAAVRLEQCRLSAKLARDAEAQIHAHGFNKHASAISRELASLSNRIGKASY